MNFEHYKETHNKRFSSRHYCPMENCNSSYSRKNVLAAHLRKAHEVPENDLVEHTSHDEPLTIDCLLCGADLTSLSTGIAAFFETLTLLMAQWVDMEALDNRNRTSLQCSFDSLGAIRQIRHEPRISLK